MSKKDIIIFTLGNRDLQFNKNFLPNLLIKNNEDSKEDSTYTINTRHEEKTFWEISQSILQNIGKKEFRDAIIFPMIDTSLNEINIPSQQLKIIFTSSEQIPNDKQDCKFIAEICSTIYGMKGYETEIKNFNCNPTDFKELTLFYNRLFERLNEQNVGQIFISNSGGTPDMRSATYFAGFLKEFEYISINSRTNKSSKDNFNEIENNVLNLTIKKMLLVYDYSGILNLPLKNMKVKSICNNALNTYNLNVDYPNSKIGKQQKPPYGEHAKFAISLLVDNLFVCYKQQRYAEALQRIFRIEEAIWNLLFYNWLKENNHVESSNPNKVIFVIESETKKKNFEEFLNFGKKYLGLFLQSEFPSLTIINNESYFIKSYYDQNDKVPLYGKNYFYHFFRHIGEYDKICNFLGNLNKDNSGKSYTQNSILNSLRNKSYLGHGIAGVTKDSIDKVCMGSFEKFNEELREILFSQINLKCEYIFNDFNEEIINELT